MRCDQAASHLPSDILCDTDGTAHVEKQTRQAPPYLLYVITTGDKGEQLCKDILLLRSVVVVLKSNLSGIKSLLQYACWSAAGTSLQGKRETAVLHCMQEVNSLPGSDQLSAASPTLIDLAVKGHM